MLPLLLWVPIVASFVLGLLYLISGEGRPRTKALIGVVFVAAAFLQFETRFSLIGFLLQAGLALGLAIWWKIDTTG